MRRLFAAIAFIQILAATADAQLRDTAFAEDALSKPEATMIVATLGSAGGMVGGALAGVGLCKATGWGDSGEDPCLGHFLLGGLAGSILGSALGAYAVNARTGMGFSRPLRSALGATIVALGVGYVLGKASDSPGPLLVGYTVTQGVVTGLLTTSNRGR